MVKRKSPPAMQETRFVSLSQGEPLEKEMATHSGILSWDPGQNPMDSGAWWSTVYGISKSWT